jgi:hypothetical protein
VTSKLIQVSWKSGSEEFTRQRKGKGLQMEEQQTQECHAWERQFAQGPSKAGIEERGKHGSQGRNRWSNNDLSWKATFWRVFTAY